MYTLRGLCEFEEEQYDAAIEDFTTVLEKDPSAFDIFYQRGIVESQKGGYENAIKDLAVYTIQYPSNTDAQLLLSQLYALTSDWESSLARCEQLLEYSPNSTDALSLCGSVKPPFFVPLISRHFPD